MGDAVYFMCFPFVKSEQKIRGSIYHDVCGIKLNSVDCVQVVGVKIVSSLKCSQQCVDAARKANIMFGFL